jgi:hypothetical protein
VLCKLLEEHKGEVKTATTQVRRFVCRRSSFVLTVLQLLAHLHASLGDELTDPSSIAKLPDAAQVQFCLSSIFFWF